MKIYAGTLFRHIREAFAKHRGVDPKTVEFRYSDRRVELSKTPNKLGMDSNTVIDCIRYTN